MISSWPGGGLDVELVPRLGPTVADYPAGSTFGPREARSYEFVWVLRGRATWFCDDHQLRLAPGALLLVRPGMRDSFRWDPRTSTRHAYVHFNLTGAATVDDAGWPLVRDLGLRPDPLAALCQHLLWLGAACPPGWQRHAEETVRLLLLTFVDGATPGDSAARTVPEPITAMMAEVRRQWSTGVAHPLELPRLAAAAGVSPSTLCRLFAREFGLGPVAAVERLRLARAEPLLWMSNLSLQAIAVQCGFADAYHLSRRFRAVYGTAPSAFRARTPDAAPSPVERNGLAVLAAMVPGPRSGPVPGPRAG